MDFFLRSFIYLICAFFTYEINGSIVDFRFVAVFLLLFCYVCCTVILNDKKTCFVVNIVSVCAMIFVPYVVCFLPVVLFELTQKCYISKRNAKNREFYFWIILMCITIIAAIYNIYIAGIGIRYIVYTAFISIASIVICCLYYRNKELSEHIIEIRDNSKELNEALAKKNKYLIESQDSEIYNATLKERNRIAREIHDNVGHMLSRALIQNGALISVTQDEKKDMLISMRETLDEAMTSIRTSVHDLHDESIDLKKSIEEAISPLVDYKIDFLFDVDNEVPSKYKYCFISVIKEAVSNIIKYSNGDEVTIALREHPAFYQLLIKDNGNNCNNKNMSNRDMTNKTRYEYSSSDGIGLVNMKDRVEAIGGNIDINFDNGCRIFITLNK